MANALRFVFLLTVALQTGNYFAQDVPKWQLDGSPGLTSSGNFIQSISTGQDPENGMWMEGVSQGSRYWIISLSKVDGSISVGTSSIENFGLGYKTKGLFYNGNLHQGNALLVADFGPRLKSGDIVGMLVAVGKKTVQVFYDVNGISLGKAFTVDANLFSGPLYPVVQFLGSGEASITEEPPPAPTSPPTSSPTNSTSIVGKWILQPETLKCDFDLPIPPSSKTNPLASMNIKNASPSVYDVDMAVINRIGFKWTYTGSNWSTSPQQSTKMYGPPENMAVEDCLLKMTNNPTSVTVSQDGKLQIVNGALSSRWETDLRVPSPFSANPLH